ncbi:cytochrome c nitrite reductase small subunit [Helicobacter sp. MIT 14-3879]|uniref:cytochrome c nitrite reductase small subunit n=1 Tax=Helicobacter sp. MIT 14-3879 TaxID=2040649 RepID=UPI000E1E67EA|nr:cytochrome c nitrite reductase small subunit [Helicobacter sp. MIT 14-3879]
MKNNIKKPIPILTLAVIIAVGFVVGAGSFTFWYAKGFSYFSNDSKACNNCHVMNEVYKDWSIGSHKNYATCNDCHIPDGFVSKWLTKAQSGFSHAYSFTLKDIESNLSATQKSKTIVQENCIRCHSNMVSSVVNPTTKIVHNYDKSLSCVSCHKNIGHIRNF